MRADNIARDKDYERFICNKLTEKSDDKSNYSVIWSGEKGLQDILKKYYMMLYIIFL